MKKTVCITLSLATLLLSNSILAQDKLEFSGNCKYPNRPAAIDGSTKTEAEMITFSTRVKEFQVKGTDFLACLDEEEGRVAENATKDQLEDFKERIDQTYNAVVDEMNASAADFNTALRAYKNK